MSDNLDTLFEADNQKARSGNSTIEFVRVLFTNVYALLLWLIVIGCTVGGYQIGKMMEDASRGQAKYAVLGGLIGLIVGVCFAIWKGGKTAVLLSIGENIRKIAEKMDTTCGTDTQQKTTVGEETPKFGA